jgi:glutathione reductase (NADPH)
VQPKKVAVIGAGYIAVEMAGILHGLGSECHLFFRGDTVLRHGFDPFVVEALMEALEEHGPSLHPRCTPTGVTRDPLSGALTLQLTASDGGEASTVSGFDCVLLAVGRRPETALLKLGAAGVTVNGKGYIQVDRYENTSAAGVYAIGDATTSGYELTPVSKAERALFIFVLNERVQK